MGIDQIRQDAGIGDLKIEDVTVESLRIGYLRTLARGWCKGFARQAVAMDALLDGKKVSEAARLAGMHSETCRNMWKRFQTFVKREEQMRLARRVVPLADDDQAIDDVYAD